MISYTREPKIFFSLVFLCERKSVLNSLYLSVCVFGANGYVRNYAKESVVL